MKPLRYYGRYGFVHVEPRPGGHAFVRWFRYPLGAMREDGQPRKDWDWFCAIELHGTELWAFGAKGMPSMREFRDILRSAALLGATELTFEHREIVHRFPLTKYFVTPPELPALPRQTNQRALPTMPEEIIPTASFKLVLEVKGKETDTITWENPACPLPVIAARQSVLLQAFADATRRQSEGAPIAP